MFDELTTCKPEELQEYAERISFFNSGLCFAIIGNNLIHCLAVIGLTSVICFKYLSITSSIL